MDREEWALGTATATVVRDADSITITLRGIVTAMAYEALSRRATASRARTWTLFIGDAALLVATAQSLAEAATRALPTASPPTLVALRVSSWRLAWATDHCECLQDHGAPWSRVEVIPEGLVPSA